MTLIPFLRIYAQGYNHELSSLVKEQRTKLAHQSLFIDQLLEQIKLAQHLPKQRAQDHFGVKSEHISPDHLPRIECEQTLLTAPMPPQPQPIPKSNATPGTLAYLIIAKYLDGMPLYRLERQLARNAMPVPRSTQANWMIQSGQLIQPLINLLRDRLLSYDIIAMDESRYQVLREEGKTAQSQSYIWVQRGGPPDTPVILYDYYPSRSQNVPLRLLDDFKGYLQTDAYEGYGAVCRANGLISVGCMAHAGRKFDEALKALSAIGPAKQRSTLAATALHYIQTLYRIERDIKLLSAEAKLAARQSRSVPVLNKLRAWLDINLLVVPPKSTLGKGMNYLHKQWEKLTVYTTDGRLRIDNNLAENAVRPFVLGRKVWLFANTVAGANASANLYSLLETVKANGHEPYAYLCPRVCQTRVNRIACGYNTGRH